MRRLAAVVLTGAVLVSGCAAEENPADPLQLAATLEPARPAVSPEQSATPEGRVVPLGRATSVAVAGGRVAVAVADPPSVALYPVHTPGDPVVVPLPGPAERLVAVGDAVEAVVPAGVVVTIRPDGSTSQRAVEGGPVDVARVDGATLVAQRDLKQVEVDGHVVRGISSPDRLVAVGDAAVVLDRPRSAVFDLDPAADGPGAGCARAMARRTRWPTGSAGCSSWTPAAAS